MSRMKQNWAVRHYNKLRLPEPEPYTHQQSASDPVVEAEREAFLARQAAKDAERQARKAAGDPELVGRRVGSCERAGEAAASAGPVCSQGIHVARICEAGSRNERRETMTEQIVVADPASRALDDYDPAKGLKKVAVAEVAEKYYARAKDPTRLFEALEAKLIEQRQFVLWWDGQKKHPGNRGSGQGKVRPSQIADGLKLDDLGLDHDTVHRWRKRLGTDDKFKEALLKAQQRCVRIAEFHKGVSEDVHASSESPDWNTPPHIVAAVVEALGAIDLDPCSNYGTPNVPASRHFTAEDDGLEQDWTGRVYMNPPYGDVIPEWTNKLIREFRRGRVTEAIALVPARTDTKWFDDLFDCVICFVTGRLRFSDSDTGAPFPSAAVYFGVDAAAFAEAFRDIGNIVVKYE